jgi:hypothetical protein
VQPVASPVQLVAFLVHARVNVALPQPREDPMLTVTSGLTVTSDHTGLAALVARPMVAVDPNSKLPGTPQLTSLVGGLMTWVLLACVAAVLAGAAAWGIGSRSGHFGATQNGRLMVLGGVAGAMITGAATALVNFGFGVGATVH